MEEASKHIQLVEPAKTEILVIRKNPPIQKGS
jgi:hypothetical protein